MNQEKLNSLLGRSTQFLETVHAHVGNWVPYEGDRFLVAFQAGLLSLEHAASAHTLFSLGLSASAYTLLRPQYECLVRGVWLTYAAADTWIAKLSEPLTVENASRAEDAPMLAKMLTELEASPDSPKPIVAQLKQYKDVTWKALNSYAHGGFHPLSRTLSGYPAQLTYDVVRNSNAVTALTTQLMSILAGNLRNQELMRQLHAEFADCLPILCSP